MNVSNDVVPLFLRLGLGFLWLWEGATKIRFSPHELVDLVMGTRLLPSSINVKPWVPVLGVIEIVLGACVLFGFRTRLAAGLQSIMVIGFTTFLIIGYPDLMYHPLGPLIKNFAILGAQLALCTAGSGRILSLDGDRVLRKTNRR
ncbi:MAG: DoxX-like family protein [Acidobacteria bacterium]|nr:DoxX-like family protein [Acidobacteriota bacterium]MBI3657824.1 DoxX-like family protein [Acidobacteriota bacterium]